MSDLTKEDPLSADGWLANRLDAWLRDLVATYGQGRPGADLEVRAAAMVHVARTMIGADMSAEERRWCSTGFPPRATSSRRC